MVTGETAHHLNVLVRMLTNMLDIDAVRVFLHTLSKSLIGCLDLGKKCPYPGQNWGDLLNDDIRALELCGTDAQQES
jgi:hypothetical protein